MDDVKGTFDEGIRKEVNQVKDTLLEDKKADKAPSTPADPYATAEEKKDKPA